MTPIRDRALEIGCVCTHQVDPGCHGDKGKQQKEDDVHGYFVVRATSRPVISRLIMATGNRNVHANFINWS